MAFDNAGNLFVATGDQGHIHRITPDGKGSVFFRTEETHARSLAIDSSGNLIVGTEPGGLILRISPAAAGFVLYQAPKREITAVAVAPNGMIFAAGVGNRGPALPVVPPPIPLTAPTTSSATGPATASVQPSARSSSSNPPQSFTPASISGGSDVYCIDADGSPRKVWSNAQDIVYAIGFDASGLPLFGTGNRGRVYRLDSDVLSTQLLNLAPTQVTSFAKSPEAVFTLSPGTSARFIKSGRVSRTPARSRARPWTPALSPSGAPDASRLELGHWGPRPQRQPEPARQ